MEIFINNTPITTDEGMTIDRLLQSRGIPSQGVAVAVNNRVVSRTMWSQTVITEGDRLTVIQAVCGG